MALRQIVEIDEEKCDGCGDCIPSCAEGAIQLIDGKARLVGENLCDGLGACLGECPQGAITVEEREANEYDEAAVATHLESLGPNAAAASRAHDPGHADVPGPGGQCPGTRMIQLTPLESDLAEVTPAPSASALRHWPVQLHLVSPEAPYYQGANVLLAADCTAYALGDFHSTHLKGKSLAIACPKLDQGMEVYLDKLVAMIDKARIDTLTVLVMEVPCCTGLVQLARQAAQQVGRKVPIKQVVVGVDGAIRSEEWL